MRYYRQRTNRHPDRTKINRVLGMHLFYGFVIILILLAMLFAVWPVLFRRTRVSGDQLVDQSVLQRMLILTMITFMIFNTR